MSSINSGGVTIVAFAPEHRAAFEALNRAWLEAYEILEPLDEVQLRNPDDEILGVGGAIYVAIAPSSEVIGSAALIPVGPNEMELAKVAVAESARGAGIGRALVQTCLDHAKEAGVSRLVLASSRRLESALRLYEAMGFQYEPVPASYPYVTAEVYMALRL